MGMRIEEGRRRTCGGRGARGCISRAGASEGLVFECLILNSKAKC